MPKTYNDLYLETRRAFREAGIEAYSIEARLITAFAAEKPIEKFIRDLRLYAGDETAERLRGMVARRLSGEPAAYITGAWEFYGLPLEVDRTVLIPRSDTEVLVDAALENLRGRKMDARVLDLCCGSGCVGCAVAHELPATRVVMADISTDALHISRINARLNGLSPRITCIELDATEPPPMLIGTFDIILCNPPYIPTADILELDSSVRDYEPVWALDGGEDGLTFYRAVTKNWKDLLRPGGALLFEVGEDQAGDVKQFMTDAGFKNVSGVFDTAGIERVITGNI